MRMGSGQKLREPTVRLGQRRKKNLDNDGQHSRERTTFYAGRHEPVDNTDQGC